MTKSKGNPLRLKGFKILLGLTGGIAIYKAADLVRRLTVDYGAEVQVVMTASAQKFMSPLVFEALSGKPVLTHLFSGGFVGTRHISLAKEADLILIAPASANIIAKTVHGIADDLLSTIILAGWHKMLFAPAMNVNMLENPATRTNIEKLMKRGVSIINPGEGLLACHDEGKGKMASVAEICEAVEAKLLGQGLLTGKKVVVTAGPTREKIDAVRYISNYSTGKMGLALAMEAKKEGAQVTLITGPVSLDIPRDIDTVKVESAREMLKALLNQAADYLYMSAAVEDIVPEEIIHRKLKKEFLPNVIPVKKAPDIVSAFRKKFPDTKITGFSVEIEQGKENSLYKMETKGLDFIIWNNPETEGAAFGHDTNEVTVFSREGKEWFLPKDTKRNIASRIIKITTGTGA
ncbi:MAG: bifunctional phosphopantothenoylcysteine decarboxylase/phosphopantothenate--cysteine ligase CoaBC [Candidatus Marinimicrobia bacterium]|nr:bifunctional phosphopantothenoylcysteine decarboxylase/phosphopantothenate--cysteine ligase CoaBC [Candidatus Neomarinimicrobiota bacterium]